MTGNRIYYAHLKCHDWDDTLCFRGEKGANSFRKKLLVLQIREKGDWFLTK